jgi:hypothetical protein
VSGNILNIFSQTHLVTLDKTHFGRIFLVVVFGEHVLGQTKVADLDHVVFGQQNVPGVDFTNQFSPKFTDDI